MNVLYIIETGQIISRGKLEYKSTSGQSLLKNIQFWPTFPDGNPMQKCLCKVENGEIRAKTKKELDAEEAATPRTFEERLATLEAKIK